MSVPLLIGREGLQVFNITLQMNAKSMSSMQKCTSEVNKNIKPCLSYMYYCTYAPRGMTQLIGPVKLLTNILRLLIVFSYRTAR